MSPAQLKSQEQDRQIQRTVPELFSELDVPSTFILPWTDLLLLDLFSLGSGPSCYLLLCISLSHLFEYRHIMFNTVFLWQ